MATHGRWSPSTTPNSEERFKPYSMSVASAAMIKPYVPPQQDRTLGALETQTVQSKPYTEHYNVLMKMKPCFVPLDAEVLRPSSKSKRKIIAWDGAHQNVIKPIQQDSYKCEACHRGFPEASYLANANYDMSFCEKVDPFLSKITEQMGMAHFTNQFKNSRPVCVVCLHHAHKPEETGKKKPYYTVDAEGYIKLESRWLNARKKTTQIRLRPNKLDKMFKLFEARCKKQGREHQFSAEWMWKKYLELVEKGAHPAADWVWKLGENCYILYYCVGCDTAPIAANMWYRCTFKPELLNLRDQYSGPSGHWRCAVCLERYKQGDADKYSLFVVGDSSSHFVAFIGNVSSNIKNQITLLKSYTLVTQIGEVEITVENILQALREFNAESDNHLGCFPQVKAYRAKDPSSVQDCFAYGEDPNLSIMKTNQIVKALDLSDVLVRTMD